MEGQDKDSKHNRSKQRSSEEREEEHGKESRRKEEKRKKEGKTSSSSSTATTTRQSKQLAQAASGSQGSRYHHREVPPRFQHQKQAKQQKYSKTNQAVNKKPMKDSSRWQQPPQQPQPLHHHHHSTHPNHHHPHHHPPPSQSGTGWMEDDGGWSAGAPVKGSGWGSEASLSGPISSADKDRTKGLPSTLDKDWTNSETVNGNTSAPALSSGGGSSEFAGNRSSAGVEGGGGLWLTLDSGTSDSDTWRPTSPGYSSKHSQADNWTASDDNEGSQNVGESVRTGMGPSGSGKSTPGDGGPINSSESKSTTWAVGSKWEMPDTEPIGEDLDRELATELNCSAGAFSLEEGGSRGEFASSSRSTQEGVSDWDELDTSSLSSNDRDPLAQTLTLNGGTGVGNTGDGKEGQKSTQQTTTDNSSQNAASLGLSEEQKDYGDPASDGGSTVARSESSSSYGLLQTLSGGDSSGSNSQENPDLSRAGSTTDNVWMRGKEIPLSLSEGGGGGVWRPTRSSTSSVNSVGSTSSWKSDNGKSCRSYQNRGNIPHKPCRFESSSSQLGLNGSLKVRKPKKPTMDLEDALESLHCEPSGWGELPSPKINDNDDGTGIWGEPPDIKSHNERKSSGGQGPAVNWNDSHYSSPVEWGDDDPSGAIAAGWGGKESSNRTPTSAGGQWVGVGRGGGGTGGGGPLDGWSTVVTKHKDKTSTFADNLKKLMDMGFPRQASEKYLKANSNDIDAAIGDLLAVTALADDVNGELVNGTAYPLQNSRSKRHGKSLGPGGAVSFQSALSSTSTSSVTGIPSTSNSTLNSTPTGLTPGFNPKDPLYQQLAALQMFGSIPGLQPPLPNQQPNQAQALMQMQLLQQLQQRYLLNQLQLGPMFTPVPNLQSYQQLLTQQLGQLRLMKQQLAQQAKSAGQNPQQQQLLTLRMGQVNQGINQINRQLVILSQISSQQKDAAKNQDGGKSTPTGIASPSIGRNTPPIRKGDPNLGGVSLNRSMSANVLGDTGKNLSYGMQGLSLSGSGTSPPPPLPPSSAVSQSSARSISRLQWIISGSANSDNPTSLAPREEKPGSGIMTPSSGPFPSFPASSSIPLSSLASSGQGPVHPIAPVYPPTVGLTSFPSHTANTVTVSSSHFPSPKSFDDIQEFKPGVPWQPRAQPTEPAQVYPKPPSTMGTYSSGIAFHSGRSNPPFPFSQSNPGGFTKAVTPGSGPKVTRQKSGGDGGSGVFFGGYPPPTGMQPFGSQSGSGNKFSGQFQSHDSRQPWNPLMPDSHGGVPFGQSQSHPYSTHRGSQRTNIRNPPGPFGGPITNQHPLTSSQPFSNLTAAASGRKQQQPPHFPPLSLLPPTSLPPTSLPPTSLPPTHLPYKGNRGFPPGTRAPGNKPHMGHRSLSTPAHMESSKQWGSVVEPPTKSVWGVDNSKQQKWGLDNHMWNMPTGSSELRPPSSLPSDPSPPSYTSPPSQPNTSSDPYAFTMPSVASGCWEGLHSPRHDNMLSPEPTFDEWQAGKKARLSVFKLPSNPPSPWLILRNVTSQVDESSLRDVCSECGVIQSCVINSALESALIRYNSCNEAILAKAGLDKNPTICGVDVTSDFAAETDIAIFFEQLSISKEEAGMVAAGGLNMPSALGEVWFSGPLDRDGTTLPPSSLPSADTSTAVEGPNKAPPKWDDPPTPFSNDPSTMTGMSGATTTAAGDNSLWSNGGFLPGLPTPWCNNFTHGNQEGEDHSVISGSPSMSTFLPNGLL